MFQTVYDAELAAEVAELASGCEPVVPLKFQQQVVRGNVADYPQDTRLFTVEQIGMQDAMAEKILLIVLVQVSRQLPSVKQLGEHLSARFPRTEVRNPMLCGRRCTQLTHCVAQALVIKASNIEDVRAYGFPNLVICDLQDNRIRDHLSLATMLVQCPRLETLNLRGNPICQTKDWNADVHPLPANNSPKWALLGPVPNILNVNGMSLKKEHIVQVIQALSVSALGQGRTWRPLGWLRDLVGVGDRIAIRILDGGSVACSSTS